MTTRDTDMHPSLEFVPTECYTSNGDQAAAVGTGRLI